MPVEDKNNGTWVVLGIAGFLMLFVLFGGSCVDRIFAQPPPATIDYDPIDRAVEQAEAKFVTDAMVWIASGETAEQRLMALQSLYAWDALDDLRKAMFLGSDPPADYDAALKAEQALFARAAALALKRQPPATEISYTTHYAIIVWLKAMRGEIVVSYQP